MSTPTATLAGRRPPRTLADLLLPSPASDRATAILRAVVLVVAGAALTAAAAQVRFLVPWTPVPYTGQTAAVLLVGTALGPWLGGASMALYLVAGTIGLPVFSNGDSGLQHLVGITGGYLVGFFVAAVVVGALARRAWDRTRLGAALLMATGNLVIYAIGVPVLAIAGELPLGTALSSGALVFLPWDAAKVVIAALALPVAWRLAGGGQRG